VKRFPVTLTSLAALAYAAGVADCAPAAAVADPPPTAPTAASPSEQQGAHAQSEAQLQRQLEDARKQLEDSARQVAELSEQLGRPLIQRLTRLPGESGRAIIGVQLEDSKGGRGAYVREISPGGPAAEAGIRAGDVITTINGSAISGDDAAGQVVAIMPDSKVTVRIVRDGTSRELTIVARPGPAYFLARGRSADFPGPQIAGLERLLPPMLMAGPLGDMELVTLTPQLGRYFGSDKGVLVVRAPPGLKLEGGDVILSIDGRQPLSGSHATRILASYQPGEKLTMSVMRMHRTLEVQTTVPQGEGALRLPAPPVPPPPDGPVSDSSTGTAGARGGHSLAGV
jgi:membrane-associated protease RseP (regulator of RpoE activity)